MVRAEYRPYLLLSPALVSLAFLLLAPIVFIFVYSFWLRQANGLDVPAFQFGNWQSVLGDPFYWMGLRETFDNITGYTLGYYSHATTHTSDFTRIFHPQAEWCLEPGMVFHMYVSAAGASFSETVLVTEKGAERLTRTPRRLLAGGAEP